MVCFFIAYRYIAINRGLKWALPDQIYLQKSKTAWPWQPRPCAHPARIAIIQQLLKSDTCINSDLVKELGLAQATISQHLSELKEVGLIQGTIEGTRLNYCINPKGWQEVKSRFLDLFAQYHGTTTGTCC